MLNKMILLGYLGGTPEENKVNFSAEILNFYMATSESYTDKNTNEK